MSECSRTIQPIAVVDSWVADSESPMRRRERGPRITGAIRRDDQILRLGGDGWMTSMTWTFDDKQLLAVCDGCGWPEEPEDKYYSSCLFRVARNPEDAAFENVRSYPSIPLWDLLGCGVPPYYALATLAVDGRIYQFLSTF